MSENVIDHPPVIKAYHEISLAEWIIWIWHDCTEIQQAESHFIRFRQRALDEAMKLAGGSIEDLKPYLWAAEL